MSRAFIALGSNLEAPAEQVRAALATLAESAGVRLVRASSLYRTAPVGYADQPDFINAVAELDTTLTPHQLLDTLMAVETRFGRVRTFRNAPRVLDLDVLLYEDLTLDDERLTVPHPRMHERAFVLVPLAEIAPDVAVGTHGTASQLMAGLAHDDIRKYDDAA
ncbi:2-amino-4-hydroxy-6-hydroxymethyldihydropteridine diphosphokinase [Neisseriaceae bacterium JH1-16]|nr:2-amino-4-hydroxy-6-hydroxymethyldihydropteridine diphosphokinase [Neisseriaceae bacterium JH1-16]